MSQKSFVPQAAKSVSQALMSDSGHKYANVPHPLAFLRPRRDRPRSRPAEKRG
jgi:hypothetical protein